MWARRDSGDAKLGGGVGGWWLMVRPWLLWVKAGLQSMICDSMDVALECFPSQYSIGHNFLSTCVILVYVGPIKSTPT